MLEVLSAFDEPETRSRTDLDSLIGFYFHFLISNFVIYKSNLGVVANKKGVGDKGWAETIIRRLLRNAQ